MTNYSTAFSNGIEKGVLYGSYTSASVAMYNFIVHAKEQGYTIEKVVHNDDSNQTIDFRKKV